MVRVAVVGAGAWGINHVRAFARLKDVELVMVCDAAEEARRRAQSLAPKARTVAALADVLEASNVDAVVLATPAARHAAQAIDCLRAGRHVFVEKPLALTVSDAAAVVEAAAKAGRTLMVGHLMLYHPAVDRLTQLVRSGEIGRILYLYSLRV